MRAILILFSFLAIFLLSIYFLTCSKNPLSPQDTAFNNTVNAITSLQDSNYNLYSRLKVQGIPDSIARDSVTAVFNSDSSVASAMWTSQGILVQYVSGILGGIFLDTTLDSSTGTTSVQKLESSGIQNNLTKVGKVGAATSAKTIFIRNTQDFDVPDNVLQDSLNVFFPKIGYAAPTVASYANGQATVAQFASLSSYGVIIISGHGIVWPNCQTGGIQEVYCMTGEHVNPNTNKTFRSQINNGSLPLITISHSEQIYCVSPSFVAGKNNFLNNSSVIYGSFCFSSLGNWSELVSTAHAMAYLGYSWEVRADFDSCTRISFFNSLTDTKSLSINSIDIEVGIYHF